MEREIIIGKQASGEIRLTREKMDEWLMAHSGREALIYDTKSQQVTRRYFIPKGWRGADSKEGSF